ncbi:MAG: sigma-70 family RNA polymerase sigma factor [Prevotellaceae bacterium]|jgi:RNA polymerase sigma-70 factor (ECF subfamily)|nr:sigma-70 family RNA polymerase sigma factor [Prevotellaceae bacterium]
MTREEMQQLAVNSQAGSTKAFELLVVELQPLIFRLAFRLLCSEDDAKDAVQETFIRVWQRLNRYNPQYLFSTWVYKIAVNLCYDRLRAAKQLPKRENCSVASWEENISLQSDAEAALINRELGEYIAHFTAGLTPKQKLVFTLRDVQGFGAEEVEKITGLSPEKIKSNLYLARKYIREKIVRI